MPGASCLTQFRSFRADFARGANGATPAFGSGHWEEYKGAKPTAKKQILELWDAATAELNVLFPKIAAPRFRQVDKAFGQWESSGTGMIQYAIENEIHHRGQGYVYLRALGLEPPPFWDRN